MIQAIPLVVPHPAQPDLQPALQNPAVALCAQAWQQTLAEARRQKKERYAAECAAAKAYRAAMPPLAGRSNIADFIACVGYGMLVEAISEASGTRLLYAAQIASAASPREAPKTSRTASAPPETATPAL